MRDTYLRWGAIIGLVGAGLGLLSYIAGAVMAPVQSTRLSGDAAITNVFIHILFVLAVLGVVLGLAYYGGMRATRELLDAATADDAAAADRTGGALTGAVVMLIYWFVTRLYQYIEPPFGTRDTSLGALEGTVILGVVFVLMGAGLGSMGARMVTSKRLVNKVIVPVPVPAARAASATPMVPASAAGDQTPAPAGASEQSAAPTESHGERPDASATLATPHLPEAPGN